MKKFKLLLIATLLISALALSTMLCACNKDNGDTTKLKRVVEQEYDNVSVSIYSSGSLTLKSNNYSVIINSVEELNAFCDKDTSPIFGKENKFSNGQNQKIINVLKENDQQFFKKKSLVVLFRERGSSELLYDFNDYAITNSQLDITLSMTTPKEPVDYTCDMTTFIYIFKFDKSKIKGVTQINVNEIQNRKDFEFKYYSFGYCDNYAAILKSMEDLSALYSDGTSPMYRKEEYTESWDIRVNEIFGEYDEGFFQNKSLVVILKVRPCLGLESDVKYCDIVGNSMNVTLAQISEEHAGYATAMETHICLLEFDKAKVENVTQINVKEIDEILPCKNPDICL